MESNRGKESPRNSSEDQRISILWKAFEVYDVDRSGAIDYNEFKRLLQDLGWPSHEEFLSRAVRVLDQDMSGAIEFSEFLKWTEFAYASRILYRHEMYGVGPRCGSDDEISFHPKVYQSQDGKTGIVVRRSSLRTVFEATEDGEQESTQPACKPSSSSGEDMSEVDGRPDLVFQSSGSSNASDIDHVKSSNRISHFKSHDEEGWYRNNDRAIKFHPQYSFPGERDTEDSKAERDDAKHAANKGQNKASEENGTIRRDREFSAPVKEMATMVLTPSRRGNRVHTSRSRSKSAGILSDRRNGRREASLAEKREHLNLGPRTESKMTVRMRWACGQFRNAAVGDDKQGESASKRSKDEERSESGEQRDLEEMMEKSEDAAQHTDQCECDEDPDQLLEGHSCQLGRYDQTDGSGSRDVAQEVSVDLRRTRSE